MVARLSIVFIILLLIPSKTHAEGFNNCSNIFLKTPSAIEDKVITSTKNSLQLCNTHYAVLYSNITKTPLYSYEKEEEAVITVKRSSVFKQDERIDKIYRSTLQDYRLSGYDKGHLTPSGDMNTLEAQQETFLLSNIAPQAPKLNQQGWRLLESSTRLYKYKITGVLFNSPKVTTIGDFVYVPSHFYKIVSDGNTCSKAFISENKNDGVISNINVSELQKLINIDFHLPLTKCD